MMTNEEISRATRWSLYAGVAMPILYFAAQIAGAPFYPNYSFVRDVASLLGSPASSRPCLFNGIAMLTGFAGMWGAFGLYVALSRGANKVVCALAGVSVFVNGVLSLKAGLYPMPDPRHGSWSFLLPAIVVAPLLLGIAMWKRSGMAMRVYLTLSNLMIVCLVPILSGMLHGVAVPAGVAQRLFAVAVFVPIGVVSYRLLRNSATNSPR